MAGGKEPWPQVGGRAARWAGERDVSSAASSKALPLAAHSDMERVGRKESAEAEGTDGGWVCCVAAWWAAWWVER
jgi:hypothetical protein